MTVALMDFVCPSMKTTLVGLRVMLFAGTAFSVTVTLIDLDTSPILTVIVEEPNFLPTTLKPLYLLLTTTFSTVAMPASEELTVKSPAGRMSSPM